MEEKIQSLQAQIKLAKAIPCSTRFTDSLKKEILDLYQSSNQRSDLLRHLDLGLTTVCRWIRKENQKPGLNLTTNTIFKTISVSAKNLVAPRIVFKNGVIVENINEDFLLKVMARVISA